MSSIWIVVIVLSVSGQPQEKLFMIDGKAYASQGLCELSGIRVIGNVRSHCEEIPVKSTK
jgi:hypothetical protein